MSKNITIKEDGTAKPMSSVSMLNLKLQSGGGSDWVPEDETPLAKIDITHNGEYVASADGYYGYGIVRVNVAGGAGAEQSGTAPTNVDGGYTVSDYDPAIDVQPYEFQQPDIGGIGSSITGISPYTGEWQNVSVDSDGNLTWEGMDPMPHAITIVKGPHKKSYLDGETIDLTGIQVRLINENGSIYADKEHPYGIVKRQELTFEPSVADKTKLKPSLYDYDGIHAVKISAVGETIHGAYGVEQAYRCDIFPHVAMNPYGSSAYVTQYNGYYYLCTSDEVTRVATLETESGDSAWGTWQYISTVNHGKFISIHSSRYGDFPESESNPSGKSLDKSRIKAGGMEVTVSWRRKDGVTLTTTFRVKVLDQAAGGGGNFSGGGGGGYGDNGGGGAF